MPGEARVMRSPEEAPDGAVQLTFSEDPLMLAVTEYVVEAAGGMRVTVAVAVTAELEDRTAFTVTVC